MNDLDALDPVDWPTVTVLAEVTVQWAPGNSPADLADALGYQVGASHLDYDDVDHSQARVQRLRILAITHR